MPPSDTEALSPRGRRAVVLHVAENVGGCLWFAALVLAFFASAASFLIPYAVGSLALGGLLLGGSRIAQRRSGVEPEPLAAQSDELPPAPGEARPGFWRSLLRRFIEQLERLN